MISFHEPKRLNVRRAHALLKATPGALLVCVCQREAEFWEKALDQAISLREFFSRKDSLSRQTTVIFYCDTLGDEPATAEAREHLREGFANSSVLIGGVRAWKAAGYPCHVWASILADLAVPAPSDYSMPLLTR